MSHPILAARVASSESHAHKSRLLRRGDLRAPDGHSWRAAWRMREAQEQRRLDFDAHQIHMRPSPAEVPPISKRAAGDDLQLEELS